MTGWSGVLIFAAATSTIGVVCAITRRGPLQSVARALTAVAMGCVWLAIIRLGYAFIVEDTSLRIVVEHSRPELSALRRIMGLWGGSAGSLLFFVAMIGTTLVIAAPSSKSLLANVVTTPLLWALVMIESPFEKLDVPAIRGTGLSPILEHWAMLAHPPLLYLGLALSLVPLVRVSSSTDGQMPIESGGNRTVAYSALGVLTIALALGGRWAYTELGWGGWWAWDPVENAALMPFLLIVMSLHAPAQSRLRYWALLMIWPVVFAATAMTRTSLRTSVHAFANAEGLGWYLWPLATAVTVAAFFLTWGEGRRFESSRSSPASVLWPTVLLGWTTLVVVLGTFRPFLPGEATTATFYENFLFPTTLLSVVMMGVLPRMRHVRLTRALTEAVVGGILGAALVAIANPSVTRLFLASALGAGVVPLLAMVTHLNRTSRLVIAGAHLGMMLVLLGALGATATTVANVGLARDESVEVSGHAVTNLDLELKSGDPTVLLAKVEVDGHEIHPSLAVHPARALRLPEVATHTTMFDETQLILRSADDDGSVLLTVNVVPLTHAVWVGATLLALASFTAGTNRKPSDS